MKFTLVGFIFMFETVIIFVLNQSKFGRIKMISHRVQKYIDDHSFCSEYLFKDWEAFLDLIYEEGVRVSSILWWEHL